MKKKLEVDETVRGSSCNFHIVFTGQSGCLRAQTTRRDQTWPHVPSRFLRSPVHFNRNVPLITLSFFSFPCLHVASSEPPTEIWGEDSRTASPAIGRSQRSMEWGAVCMCLCELKGNHVSDTHLGLSPALDRIRHAGQNPRWDTNASLSGSLNWPVSRAKPGTHIRFVKKTQSSVHFNVAKCGGFILKVTNCPILVTWPV